MLSVPISENTKKSLDEARRIAIYFESEVIGTEHVLYGFLCTDSTAGKILSSYGVDKKQIESYLAPDAPVPSGIIPGYSSRVDQTISSAANYARENGSKIVRTEHVLYAMLRDNTSYAYSLLENCGVDIAKLMRDSEGRFSRSGVRADGETKSVLPAELKDLGIDMTKKARDHKIDPVIGRKDEIERIIQILCRKTKNNPVLIGEPGVGKSAVIEGLAKEIVDGNVPELLRDKIIFSFDMGSLMAGTKYRGDLEQKLKNAIDVILDRGNIIIFIDELHSLARASDKSGEVSPVDILKPYLARGELQTIGATTTDEYRKFIETDKALERRFQPVMVEPPTVEQTIEILRGLKENYEAFHKVAIDDEALVAAATLSDRYVADRFLPDKAIDLVDEAMSRAKVNCNTVPPKIKEMEERIKELTVKKNEAASREDFGLASKYRDEIAALRSAIEGSRLDWKKQGEQSGNTITAEHIAEIVSRWTKIPVTRLSESETLRLVELEKILHERVIGQNGAIESVAKAIRRARAGLKDPRRPIGSFLFLGPTGVGKTELTKALGQAMFDDENSVIRLDMSEFMESHSVSKMIGSPPGYVGFDDGGQLTEQVRRRPYSVVLFDEIEKAHADVYNLLLQILDDGRLTDSHGRTVSFKNTIIIMTSNVGVSELSGSTRSLGFAADAAADDAREQKRREEIIMSALKRRFKPEFLNRIDVISVFDALTKAEIGQIATVMLSKVEKTLKEKNIGLAITQKTFDYIVEKGYDAEFGARPLRRVIEQKIEDNVAEAILSGKIREGDTAMVDVDEYGNVFVK